MKTLKATLLALVCALGMTSLAPAAEQKRQYYTKMVFDRDQDYYRGAWFFKAKPGDATFKFHYVIRFKAEPQYLYWYNPVTKKFWGRYDALTQKYSVLAEEDKVSRLSDLSKAKFPEPGPMPAIPGSTDGVRMDLPPGEFTPAPEMPPARRLTPVGPGDRPAVAGPTTQPPAPPMIPAEPLVTSGDPRATPDGPGTPPATPPTPGPTDPPALGPGPVDPSGPGRVVPPAPEPGPVFPPLPVNPGGDPGQKKQQSPNQGPTQQQQSPTQQKAPVQVQKSTCPSRSK